MITGNGRPSRQAPWSISLEDHTDAKHGLLPQTVPSAGKCEAQSKFKATLSYAKNTGVFKFHFLYQADN